MVQIRPLKAFRYQLPKAGDPANLLAPPYDVIDLRQHAELMKASPNNCVRVILPVGDDEHRYERAAREFIRLKQEALIQDDRPGFYVYHQQFSVDGNIYTRKGFIGLVELTAFGQGPVLAHERTLRGPKMDRLNLMRACQAHLELVFGLFPDPERQWEKAVADHLKEPILVGNFENVEHILYRVDDPRAITELQQILAPLSIYIADGHHRYETMCSFRQELEARGYGERAKFGLMYISNLSDPGLVVLPTHRLVHGVPPIHMEEMVKKLESAFVVQEVSLPTSHIALRQILDQAGQIAPTFGLCVPGSQRLYLLQLRHDIKPEQIGLAHLPPALQRLDVVLLHELVLEQNLGIDRNAQAAQANIAYYKSTEKALEVARKEDNSSSSIQLVCFMNPTKVTDVRAVCDSGEVMPQKSTFFYPKIPTGLAFYDLSADAS